MRSFIARMLSRFGFSVAFVLGLSVCAVSACQLGGVPDAAPVRDPAVERAVESLNTKIAKIESDTAARVKEIEAKAASGALTAEQAAAMKAMEEAYAARAKAQADEIAALNRRILEMDGKIGQQIRDLPAQGINGGVVGLANGILSLGLLLAARASAKKEIRRKIAEFDNAPDNVRFMPDGTVAPL